MGIFTDFCCRNNGSNLNAGTRKGDATEPGTAALLTYANGTWTNTTRTFTVAAGNPQTDGLVVGDYVALDTTGGAPPATYGGLVSTVTATTIIVDGSKNWGTNPANGTYTLRMGGAWAGPGGTVSFPTNVTLGSATNSSGDLVRVNLKNDKTYAMTASITPSGTPPLNIHGYGTTYGDGGKTTIDGSTAGSGFLLLSYSPAGALWLDSLIFSRNGPVANTFTGCVVSAGQNLITRCVFTGMGASGLNAGATSSQFVECEFYGNNTSNTTNNGGLLVGSGASFAMLQSCIFHDNTGTNSSGVYSSSGTGLHATKCIFWGNGAMGLNHAANSVLVVDGCDFYNNVAAGLAQNGSPARFWVMNSNFVKNGTWGIGSTFSTPGLVLNCGFGSGSMANSSGAIQSTRVIETGRVTFASGVTPWVNPGAGDFRINLATAQGVGRGSYTQVAPGYSGTIGYPDIGSAQHQEVAGGGPKYYSY